MLFISSYFFIIIIIRLLLLFFGSIRPKLVGCSFLLTGHSQEIREDIPPSSFESKEKQIIKVPKIYWNLTRKAVLTMEWIDGIKLTDERGLREACLNRKELIDQVLDWNGLLCIRNFVVILLLITLCGGKVKNCISAVAA